MDNRDKLRYKIRQVQKEVKQPGGKFLKFGGFRYRSCTDILQCMQPALEKYKLSVQLKTEYRPIEGAFQVDDMAIVTDIETGEQDIITGTGTVREIKTAQDVPADHVEKFCCGLKMVLIGVLGGEDELDEDDEYTELKELEKQKEENKNIGDMLAIFDTEERKMITPIQCQLLEKTAKRKGVAIESVLDYYAVNSISQLTEKNYIDAIMALQGKNMGY